MASPWSFSRHPPKNLLRGFREGLFDVLTCMVMPKAELVLFLFVSWPFLQNIIFVPSSAILKIKGSTGFDTGCKPALFELVLSFLSLSYFRSFTSLFIDSYLYCTELIVGIAKTGQEWGLFQTSLVLF